MYIYNFLYRKEVKPGEQHAWYLAVGDANPVKILDALNVLSANGWEIAGIGDFGYGTAGLDEILLRKPRN